MTHSQPILSLQAQRQLLDQVAALAAERHRSAVGAIASRTAREAALAEQLDRERQVLLSQQANSRAGLQNRHAKVLSDLARECELAEEQSREEHQQRHREIVAEAEQALRQAQAAWDTTQEKLRGKFATTVQGLQQALFDFKGRVEERRAEITALENEAAAILRQRRCHHRAAELEEPRGACNPRSPLEDYPQHLQAAREQLQLFPRHWPPFVLSVGALLGTAISLWLAGIGLGAWLNRIGWPWIAGAGAAAVAAIAIIYVIVRPILEQQTLAVYQAFRQHVANAAISLDTAAKLRAAEADMSKISAQRQCDQQLLQATAEHQQRVDEIQKRRSERLKSSAEQMRAEIEAATAQREAGLAEAQRVYATESRELQERHARQTEDQVRRERAEADAAKELHERSWQRIVARWRDGLADFATSVQAMQAYCQERFPDWETTNWESLPAPVESLPAVRFGHFQFSLRGLEGGVHEHEDLRPAQEDYTLPAVLSFADRPTLLLESWGEGRTLAADSMRNVMLRLLTSLPPGKVRFTIIDPVGLGQNFSAFMHLADYDEKLINHRIWTEPTHIQQRLVNLTEHMEDVIQTYLRNEFASIDEYNRQAGEVSEPFQVLVVANFPAGFTEEAAHRLTSIVQSGARCGVYSIISTDGKLELPRNFDLADLESHAATLQWNGQRFSWRDAGIKDLPLSLDAPPREESFTRLIKWMGQRAKAAIRVEVPFSTVACAESAWWQGDSRAGIDVALGRAGASKLQHLRLGQGTSQHVLISGKTGSGKSTLLHALITNVALHYSPDEVSFYLIDFKKGVEFKPYAAWELPHARVIAIESEREFGMSVLERLDQELKLRGDLFREAGVQDIRAFRDAHPDRRMPRILLIIDEFQEFFTQDDRLAQEAALLLDRLVRQGRAFGIHVLLGSQTLAGAYTLARSTLGQMAIRIALQCSEADSHLILSEDNTAARLLNRPGEAIYNDANGLFEGNHPFQVVWLSSADQEQFLERLSDRAQTTSVVREPAIVFEGNVPADPADNRLLRSLIESGQPATPPIPRAWLGAAVAIKEPTAAWFRRQGGANLLLVGQQEELAQGILANAIISLAATCGGGASPRFIFLDGTRAEAADAAWWRRFASQLPLDLSVIGPSEAESVVGELGTEINRRVASGVEGQSPVFLLVYNLGRFRDLRRSDDDLSFGGFGEEKAISPSKQFAEILRDGPGVGVHSLVWCDTFNTLGRWLERASLRELDQRILFQMSANDSSNLMDSPAASHLGTHRAILYNEESGQQEKFRPYGLPAPAWLEWLAAQLNSRVPVAE